MAGLENLIGLVEAIEAVKDAINGGVKTAVSAILDHTGWTDGGAAVGTIATGLTIPADAIVESFKFEWTEAPDVDGAAGETDMEVLVGEALDTDRLCQATDPSTVIATGLPASFVQTPTNPSDAGDGDTVFDAATALILTGTLSGGAPDFSNFVAAGGAGKCKLTVIYREMLAL